MKRRDTPAPRFAGIGGHQCIGCTESDPEKFGLKRGKPRSRCKQCTNVKNGESRQRARRADERAYLRRNAGYARQARARMPADQRKAIYRQERLRRYYGLTVEQFEKMLRRQRGKCLICRARSSRMAIDHDHTTGRVRGILCNNCNTGLGLFADSPRRLKNAIEYLRRTRAT